MKKFYENESYIYNRIPARIYHHKFEKEKIVTSLHWHRSVEINLVTKGRIRFNVIGGNQILNLGDWNIVNSNMVHSNIFVDRQDSFEGIAVLISKSFLDTWVGENILFNNPNNIEVTEQVTNILLEIVKYYESQEIYRELNLMKLIYELVTLLTHKCIEQIDPQIFLKTSKTFDGIKNIINFIDLHYTENISLQSISKEYHYSSAYLSRIFKNQIGSNLYDYLQTVRLMHAIERINNDDTITTMDNAMLSGFPNVKSYIETFKKIYGCTPSEYKKNIKSL